jgi:hypothetical protein
MMNVRPQTVSVQIPEPIYRRLQRASELTYRSLDEIVSSVLNLGLSLPTDLPPEIRNELEAMAMFSDAALWATSESALSPAQQRRLAQLNHAGGERPLTTAESAEQAHLLEQYQHSLLRRAHALALLTYRGYDLPRRDDLPDSLEGDDNGDDSPLAG